MRGSLGEKLGEGILADVHAWAPGQVVKLFKPGTSRQLAWYEVQATHGIFAAGGPAPEMLGVVTLVHAAPVNLSLCHQGLGVILLLTSVYIVWRTRGADDSVVQPVFTDVDKGSAPL